MEVELIRVDLPLLVPMIYTRKYRLERPLEVVWTKDGGPIQRLVVPQNFETDGATIPKAFWTLIGPPCLPEFMTAAIVHDYMCEQNWEVQEMSELFLKLLNDSNVHGVKPDVMRDAVFFYKSVISR